MRIQIASLGDLSLLATMNRQLIEDERAETKYELTLPQLEKRMESFLTSVYKAYLFVIRERVVGYALCDLSQTPLYLRQFFIRREERRNGYGRQAFFQPCLLPPVHSVTRIAAYCQAEI